MSKILKKWLNVYEDEVALFLWSALLLFVVRGADVLFNNVAETAFMKRYGVQYLPIVYMINAVSTFFIMGVLTGAMAKYPDTRVLNFMLVVGGAIVAALRFVIPLGIDLIYPVLFVLKSQFEVLLALVFWNMANDLFNTRQSKRLFPLITAGGVIGAILGSFGTQPLAKLIKLDNLLIVYFVVCLIGAIVVKRMNSLYPTLLVPESGPKKKGKSGTNMIQEMKKVIPLMKESTLVKVLIVLTLMPNIVIPIFNYQFNFAINETYATEGGMIKFFAFFRGFMNVISLLILLFVGKVYGRWGLPVALMIHPFNYVIAFVAMLFRFDIYSAMYARISTNVFRTTINNPARAVLMGLFLPAHRAVIRPFLRGTVVRIATLLGSGAIMLFEGVFHPRYLSVVAIACVGIWIVYDFVLKKKYSAILLDLISRNMVDLKSLEEKDVNQVFRDKKMQSQLLDNFLSSRGKDRLWYAQVLRTQGVQGLDAHILSVLKQEDDSTRIALLNILSPEVGKEAAKIFRDLADPQQPELLKALARAANRLSPDLAADVGRHVFEISTDLEVKAYSLIGFYRQDPGTFKPTIDRWLESQDRGERKAGIIAAGESGDKSYGVRLRTLLAEEKDPSLLSPLLKALSQLETPELNTLVLPYFIHPEEPVRAAALEAFEVTNDQAVRSVINLMGDPSEGIHEKAKEKIAEAAYSNPLILVESLNIPRRKVREGLFQVLEILNIRDLDVYRFARSQIEGTYAYLSEAKDLASLPDSPERNLLVDHMNQKRQVQVENTLRVLSAQDRSGQMRILWRGLSSSDSRQRSNSIEALDDLVDVSLSKILLPLLEDMPAEDRLQVGQKNFQLPSFHGDPTALLTHLLGKQDWVTTLLVLYLISRHGMDGVDPAVIDEHTRSANPHVRQMAQRILGRKPSGPAQREDNMEREMAIPDRILHMKKIHIFEGLSVSELAAVASVTEEISCPAGEVVIQEGDRGDTMYLIIEGDVSVTKESGVEGGRPIELARIGVGNYFGEMALFDDTVRSATIKTLTEARLLVLDKREFTEIVREYPQIALSICRALSGRIRDLHEKVKSYDKRPSSLECVVTA